MSGDSRAWLVRWRISRRGRVWLAGVLVVLAVGAWAGTARAVTYTQQTVIGGLRFAVSVSVDPGGDVFVCCSGAGPVELPAGGSQRTLPLTGLANPRGVAVDDEGDVFVVDNVHLNVVELPAGGSQQTLPITGLSNPASVAVDSAGDVFVADFGGDKVVELPAGGSQQTLPITGLSHPASVAVDSAGDVFVADMSNDRVIELTASGVQRTLPADGLSAPQGVAVDSAGDVFVADTGHNRLVELPAGGTQQALPFSGLSNPLGVAVDPAGDVFVADYLNGRVVGFADDGGVPTNTALPAISGAVTLPSSLSTTNGTWTGCGSDGSACNYAYQWRDCDPSMCHDSTSVGNASKSGFVLGPGEDGYTIQVVVTATNSSGTGTATSAKTDAVTGSDGLPAPLFPDSAWTTPIAANPTISSNNSTEIGTTSCPTNNGSPGCWASGIAWNNGIGFTDGSVATLYGATASTPETTVVVDCPNPYCNPQVCNKSTVQVPIPPGAQPNPFPAHPSETHMSVLQTGFNSVYNQTDMVFSFIDPYAPNTGAPGGCPGSDGRWHTEFVEHTVWDGQGTSGGILGSSTPDVAGDLLQRDPEYAPVGGNFGHALIYSGSSGFVCARSQSWCGTTPTASSNDGGCTNQAQCIPEAARIQLSPSVDCRTKTGSSGEQPGDESATGVTTSEVQAQTCRTLQIYGAYVIDNNGTGNIFDQQASSSLSGGYHYPSVLESSPLPTSEVPASDYRVLAWTP